MWRRQHKNPVFGKHHDTSLVGIVQAFFDGFLFRGCLGFKVVDGCSGEGFGVSWVCFLLFCGLGFRVLRFRVCSRFFECFGVFGGIVWGLGWDCFRFCGCLGFRFAQNLGVFQDIGLLQVFDWVCSRLCRVLEGFRVPSGLLCCRLFWFPCFFTTGICIVVDGSNDLKV